MDVVWHQAQNDGRVPGEPRQAVQHVIRERVADLDTTVVRRPLRDGSEREQGDATEAG